MTLGTGGWMLGWRDITRDGCTRHIANRYRVHHSEGRRERYVPILMMPSPDPQLVANLYANLLEHPI